MDKYGYTFEDPEEAKDHDQPHRDASKTKKANQKKKKAEEKKPGETDVLELDTEGL